MTTKKKLILIPAAALLIIAISAGVLAFFSLSTIREESVIYTVPKGSSIRKNADMLESAGYIRNADFFVLAAKYTGDNSIRSGRYRIYNNDSVFRILKKIRTGEVLTAKVTIPEGYTIKQIGEAMENSNICKADDLIKYSKDPVFLKRIGINAPSAEGYLFPETYVFAEDSDARDVITYLKNKTMDVLKELSWKDGKNGMTTHELLTLASIIEREAKIKNEQKIVSSVFHNRLKIKMPLQSCATVLYALDRIKPHLLLKDLEIDSPYNTYRHKGLTPTPIASSGKGAIDAAINPAKTDYLFFVSKLDGSHYFSAKYSSHLKAQDFYLHGEKNGFKDDKK